MLGFLASLPMVWYNPFTWGDKVGSAVITMKVLVWIILVVAIAYFVADRKVVLLLAVVTFLLVFGLLQQVLDAVLFIRLS